MFAIRLPALRDRRDDILPLSDALLTECCRALGQQPAGISSDARRLLLEHDWPGNVRELRNVLERAMIEEALQTARFNKSKAAKALGVTRHQLYIRMRRHGLE